MTEFVKLIPTTHNCCRFNEWQSYDKKINSGIKGDQNFLKTKKV